MSNVWCMDQPSTRNGSKYQQLLATATSITSLSRQTVQHQKRMRILKPPPNYTVSNFVKVRNLTANTDAKPHTYNPLCCDRLHGHFQPNPIVKRIPTKKRINNITSVTSNLYLTIWKTVFHPIQMSHHKLLQVYIKKNKK